MKNFTPTKYMITLTHTKTENTFNFIKFTLIKNEPILSQVANLTPK